MQMRSASVCLDGGGLISGNERLQHFRSRNPRQVRAARSRRERKAQANEIIDRIADDRLVKVPDLNRNVTVAVGQRPKVAQVAISADPDVRPAGAGISALVQPLIE
jgi:hypothetical protein